MHSQEYLYRSLVGGNYDANNVLDDVNALSEIGTKTVKDKRSLSEFSMTFASDSTYVNFLRKKKNNLERLAPLLTTGVISKCMAKKVASSGLTYQHLQLVFEGDGGFGLNSLLSETFK